MSITKRKLLTVCANSVAGGGVIAVTIPFVQALLPTKGTIVANSPIKVDFSGLSTGKQMTVLWRRMPIWILRRTDSMLNSLENVRTMLKDPDSKNESQQPEYTQNIFRSIKPEYFICIGLCTHLGCTPSYRPDVAPSDLGKNWRGGYFCPCHGSRFDLAGRVYNGAPAPANLKIPPHTYVNNTQIVIGEDNII